MCWRSCSGATRTPAPRWWCGPTARSRCPLLNDIQAAGLTPDQLRASHHRRRRRSIFQDPNVSVVVKADQQPQGVRDRRRSAKPGPYPLTAPTTVLQMLALAGGLGRLRQEGQDRGDAHRERRDEALSRSTTRTSSRARSSSRTSCSSPGTRSSSRDRPRGPRRRAVVARRGDARRDGGEAGAQMAVPGGTGVTGMQSPAVFGGARRQDAGHRHASLSAESLGGYDTNILPTTPASGGGTGGNLGSTEQTASTFVGSRRSLQWNQHRTRVAISVASALGIASSSTSTSSTCRRTTAVAASASS